MGTYSLAGCCFPCFCFGPLLGGGGGTSTTSGEGGGTFTTSGDEDLNGLFITTKARDHQLACSTHFDTLEIQMRSAYHTFLVTNLLIGMGLLVLQ